MSTYLVQIGTLNFQNNYKVKAKTQKEAKVKAIKLHEEKGRSMDGCNVYVRFMRS